MAQIRRRITSSSFQDTSSIDKDNVLERKDDLASVFQVSPTISLISFAIWSAIVLTVGLYFNDKLPSTDSESLNKFQFNTNNVLKDLELLANLGQKVTGSAANRLSLELLEKRVLKIRKEASSANHIEYEIQEVSGNFSLQVFSSSYDITYRSIQNLIAIIGPKEGFSNHSLLINCHFDSVPTSPGASDDSLNCAVMLEILRILSISEEKLPHNIVFLFNGAEESPLIGSHGFITKHKWANGIKAFINLESCGAGGREILFQAGPNHPWLIQAYGKAAKYPSGQVIAEEIFQSGIIPSDTDFRIFRDYGQIPGLDFAHCKNGYVYHTKFDDIESIESIHGVIKHTGENMLSLAKALLASQEFIDPNSYQAGKQVYFDFFGIFFINYSSDVGASLNIVTSFLSILGMFLTISNLHSGDYFEIGVKLLMNLASLLASLIIATSYNLFVALTLDLSGYSMSWYTNTGLIILIYAIPTVLTMLIYTIIVDKWIMENVAFNAKIQLSCLGVQLLWTIFLFGSIFLNIRSSFMLLVIVLPCSLWTLITSLLKFRGNYIVWHLLFILISSISSSMFCYLGITTFRTFIPITGRTGVQKNPELLIGLLTTLFSIAIFSYIVFLSNHNNNLFMVSSLMLQALAFFRFIFNSSTDESTLFVHVKKQWTIVKVILGIHLLTFFIIISPLGFPFSVKTPQRILVTHVNRQFFDIHQSIEYSDSIFWIQNMERRGKSVLPFLDGTELLDEYCEKNGYCGLPWFSKLKESTGSTVIQSEQHKLKYDSNLELISKQSNRSDFHLEFRVSGSDHMGIIITPSKGVKLVSWNLPSTVKESSSSIAFVQTFNNGSDTFMLMAKKITPDSFIKIEVYGLYFHHEEYYTPHFEYLISKFPEWSHISPALAVYKSYTF